MKEKKPLKAYNNQELIDALKDRDETFDALFEMCNDINKFDDEDIMRIKKIKDLTQFQKDLLYLSSTMSVYKIAELYCVSARYLYNDLKIIKEILK